jgi:hypothetical protein
MESQIRANAELVRTVARESLDTQIEYDEAGVRWLDQYIDNQREAGEPDVKERLPSTLGSYLGECIRLTYGGRWLWNEEGGWAVRINEKLSVYPFNKVRKQLGSAEGESVLSFFKTIPALLQGIPRRPGTRGETAASKRPWWKFW